MKLDEDKLRQAHLRALERLTGSYGGVVVRPDRERWKPVLEGHARRAADAARKTDQHDALAWMSPVETPPSPGDYIVGESVRLLGALHRSARRLYRNVRGRYVRHKTLEALRRFDHRTLRTLGLLRSDHGA